MSAPSLDAGAVRGFDPARFTRRVSRRHRTRSVASVLVDGYTVLLAVFVAVLFGYGLLIALRAQIGAVAVSRPVTDPAVAVIPAAACLPVAGLALTVLALESAARLGPVGPDRAALAWWLWSPVPRGGLLTGLALARIGAAGALSGVVLLPVLAVVTLGPGLALGALTGALATAIAVEAAVAAQAAGRSALLHRLSAGIGALTALVLLALALCGWLAPGAVGMITAVLTALPTGWFVIAATGATWPPAVLAVVAVVLWLAVRRRLGRIATVELARAGGAALMARLWLMTGGADEAVRTASADVAAPGRAARLIRRVRTAPSALVTADVLHLVRQRGLWVYAALPVVAWLPALVVGTNGLVPVAGVLLLVALTGMDRAARSVRACAAIPELDGMLPLPASRTRRLHAVVPASLLGAVMTVLCAGLVVLGAADAGLILLGALAGAGLGACAVRSAYRPPVDFSTPPVPTAFGYVPASALTGMAHGPDLAVVVLVPVVVALVTGATAPLLVAAQVLVTLVVVTAATTPRLAE